MKLAQWSDVAFWSSRKVLWQNWHAPATAPSAGTLTQRRMSLLLLIGALLSLAVASHVRAAEGAEVPVAQVAATGHLSWLLLGGAVLLGVTIVMARSAAWRRCRTGVRISGAFGVVALSAALAAVCVHLTLAQQGAAATELWLGAALTVVLAGCQSLVVRGVMADAGVVQAHVTQVQAGMHPLTARISVEGSAGPAVEAYNQLMTRMDDMIKQLNDQLGHVSGTISEIAQDNQSLADGVNTAASSIQEMSASLEQMSSMTQQNADNAAQANGLSRDASAAADRGTQAMGQMEQAIGRIKASSDETANIVKTIDEIAFQTNLLALNASVEAARAGDAGKGFAVVAEEVRNLAQRSAEAARTTAKLISQSIQNSDEGVNFTTQVKSVLTEIVAGTGRVNDLISEIAAACKEQADGIRQINDAMTTMDSVTQQSAASSQRSAAAASDLRQDMVGLTKLLTGFGRSPAAPAQASARPAPASSHTPAPRAKLRRPAASTPSAVKPNVTKPSAAKPSVAKPSATKPGAARPGAAKPVLKKSALSKPASFKAKPVQASVAAQDQPSAASKAEAAAFPLDEAETQAAGKTPRASKPVAQRPAPAGKAPARLALAESAASKDVNPSTIIPLDDEDLSAF